MYAHIHLYVFLRSLFRGCKGIRVLGGVLREAPETECSELVNKGDDNSTFLPDPKILEHSVCYLTSSEPENEETHSIGNNKRVARIIVLSTRNIRI